MTDQQKEIAELLQRYYAGLFHGDVAALKQVFHPAAHYFTAAAGKFIHLDMPAYWRVLTERRTPAQNGDPYRLEILAIEFAGEAAARATLRCTMLDRIYTDLLSLIKTKDGWRVVSKVFDFEPFEQQSLSSKGQDFIDALREYQNHP